jgi:hypothetical protein
MANLSTVGVGRTARGTGRRQSHTQAILKTSSVVYPSALIGLDKSTGKLEPMIASCSPDLECVGVYNEKTSVTGNGTKEITAEPGVYPFAGTGFAATDLHQPAYAVDDQTVSSSSNGGARPYVGTFEMIDSATSARIAIDPLAAGAVLANTVQVFSGALVAGVLTKATAINVTANTKVTGIVVTLLGGTFAPTYVALAANMVVGAPGTGTVVIRALKVDGTAEILNTATVNVTLRG